MGRRRSKKSQSKSNDKDAAAEPPNHHNVGPETSKLEDASMARARARSRSLSSAGYGRSLDTSRSPSPRWRSRSRAGSDFNNPGRNASLEIRISAAVLNLLCCCIIPFTGDGVGQHSDSIFVLALCFLGIVWSGPLTLLAGTQMYPGKFSAWQPLEGGVLFVMLQAFGWILYSSAALLCWIVLGNYHWLAVDTLRGILTTIVILSVFAHVALNVSVNYFEVDASATITGRTVFGFLRNGKAFVSAFLSVAGGIIYVAIDFDVVRASSFAPTLKVIGCACFIGAAFTTHVLEGAYGVKGYFIYQPMVGGTGFVALQALSWCIFAIFLNMTVAIPRQPMPFGYMCLTGMLGFLSQVLLQTSVPLFDPRKQVFATGQWTNYTIVAIVAAVASAVFLLTIASDSHHIGVRQILQMLPQDGNDATEENPPTVPYPHRTVVIGNVIMFSCAPYVQICGWLQKDGFTFMPSTGGATFLLFQAFGWAFYLLACLMLPLYITLPLREAVLSVTPLAFTSQCLVTISVSRFQKNFATSASGLLNDRLVHFDENRSLSLLLSVMASVLLVSLDIMDFLEFEQVKYLVGSRMSIYRIAISVAMTFYLAAGFLVQLSGTTTYESYQFIQPFRGGVRFVARQAVGWTVYAVAMLGVLLLVVTPGELVPVPGVCSATGVVALVGLVVLLLSVSFFEESYVHNPPFQLQLSWSNAASDLHPQEFEAAIKQLDLALESNRHGLTRGDGSAEVIPLALSLLREQIQAEAAAQLERFSQPVFCLNIPSTQYRTLCFFEVAALVASFVLFLSAEALKSEMDVDQKLGSNYLTYVFMSGVALAALSATLPHVIGGKLRHGKAYKFYQPFVGGMRFIVLQGIGIALSVIGLVASLTLLAVGVVGIRVAGAFLATGALWIVGAVLLIISIEFFEEKPPAAAPIEENSTRTRSQINHQLVSLILSLSSCVLYVVADIAIFHFGFDESWLRPVLVCAWAAAVAAVPLTVFVGRSAVPVGLRSENVLLKVVGWTLWSFTLMLGALLVFNKYFSPQGILNETDGEVIFESQPGRKRQLVKDAFTLGFRNAGSWLLSTSAIGLLAQLTFALPSIAALHKVSVDDDDDRSDADGLPDTKDKHPASLLHSFLRFAMASHWANAVMIVGVITLFSFSDGTMLYIGSVLCGVFVLLLFLFPWRTISTIVQGLCLSVSLPVYFIFIALISATVVVLGFAYGCTVIFGLTLQYNNSSGNNQEDAQVDKGIAASQMPCRSKQPPYYKRNIVGHWLDKALQYFVVGLFSNLQYVHMMQASLTFLIFVGPAATTLTGMVLFAFRHFLLGTMPSTMLMAILSTMSKDKDGQLTVLQKVAVVVVLLLPLIDLYRYATAEPGEFEDGILYALCVNYGQHVIYMTSFIGNPHLMQRRRWDSFVEWKGFWSLLSRYYPNKLRVDTLPKEQASLLNTNGLYVAGWHPHGVLPITPAWYQFSEAWKSHPQLKHVDLALCSSTINHLVPHMRDMVQWTGGIEVSRTSIMKALSTGISVCIIPGGQSESIESSSSERDITLVSRHKGFVRIAIKSGATLLPIFCFGDTKLVDNVNMKALQRKSKSILGFPFPFVPYGLLNFLPIPRSAPIYVIVGTPIEVQQNDDPPEEMVNEIHSRYFREVRRIFDRHKRAAGFGGSKLIFV